jgi:hypothetical protein
MKKISSIAGSVTVVVLCVGHAAAQPVEACKTGTIAIVRLSTIKPTGTLAGFNRAVSDHANWYRQHGFSTNALVVADVLVTDPGTGHWVASKEKVMTIHYNPPSDESVKPKHDAAWDAFVKEYSAASTMNNEYAACLPKRR